MTRVLTLVACLVLTSAELDAKTKEDARLEDAGLVIEQVLAMDEGLPRDLLEKAECVLVIPSMPQAALGVDGTSRRGAMVCRTGLSLDGSWGAPAMYAIDGSVGSPLGGQAADLVLLVMNNRGVQALLNSRVTLGASASVAAGPKGRDVRAPTDATMHAEILSYSRSRGVVAGVSLEGASLRPDDDASREVYGRPMTARAIVTEATPVPASGRRFVDALQLHARRRASRLASAWPHSYVPAS